MRGEKTGRAPARAGNAPAGAPRQRAELPPAMIRQSLPSVVVPHNDFGVSEQSEVVADRRLTLPEFVAHRVDIHFAISGQHLQQLKPSRIRKDLQRLGEFHAGGIDRLAFAIGTMCCWLFCCCNHEAFATCLSCW